MNVVAHFVTFLTCTFAAIVTVGAIHYPTDGGGRLKLAALITAPLLLLLLADIPLSVILGYYLAELTALLGLIYGAAFLFTAANYGVGTTIRAVLELRDTGQRQTPPPEPPDTPPTTDEHDRPIVFEDQL